MERTFNQLWSDNNIASNNITLYRPEDDGYLGAMVNGIYLPFDPNVDNAMRESGLINEICLEEGNKDWVPMFESIKQANAVLLAAIWSLDAGTGRMEDGGAGIIFQRMLNKISVVLSADVLPSKAGYNSWVYPIGDFFMTPSTFVKRLKGIDPKRGIPTNVVSTRLRHMLSARGASTVWDDAVSCSTPEGSLQGWDGWCAYDAAKWALEKVYGHQLSDFTAVNRH